MELNTSNNPLEILEQWVLQKNKQSPFGNNKLRALKEIGLPNRGQEEFSYLTHEKLNAYAFPDKDKSTAANVNTLPENIFNQWKGPKIVLRNGEMLTELSSDFKALGLSCKSGEVIKFNNIDFETENFNYLPKADFFEELADLCAHAPLSLDISANLPEPLLILDVSESDGNREGFRTDSRIHINIAEGIKASVVYHRVCHSKNSLLQNNYVSLNLEKESELSWIQSDEMDEQHFNLTRIKCSLSEKAVLKANNFSKGCQLSRQNFSAVLRGESADASYTSTALLYGTRESNQYINIHHRAPGAYSNQLFNNLLGDKSRCTTDATIVVYPKADLTEAKQLIHNLMLSDDAKANNKPNLMIYADEVKCNHGATIGQTDAQQLFYLLSRGISPTEAQWMLNQAAIAKNLEAIAEPEIKTIFTQYFKKPS